MEKHKKKNERKRILMLMMISLQFFVGFRMCNFSKSFINPEIPLTKKIVSSARNHPPLKLPPTKQVLPTPISTALPPTFTPTPSTTPTKVSLPWQKNNKLLCTNCIFAPVDKQYKLPATYKPSVIETNLPGGHKLTKKATKSLRKLFTNAKKQNIKIEIISGYRSYEKQKNTFNYWVNQEIKKGYNRQTAELKANNYSAKPGHSEHQLGTTADLKCINCNPFDNSAGNKKMYIFLQQNAHKYGFVISYTAQTVKYTGYKYEPWHIRYIGVKEATKIYKLGYLTKGSTLYVAKFLQDANN